MLWALRIAGPLLQFAGHPCAENIDSAQEKFAGVTNPSGKSTGQHTGR